MIKILYLIDKMKPAGAQKHLTEVVSGLDKSKFEVKLVTLAELGVKRIYGISGIKGLLRMVRLMKNEKFDIVHTYLFSENILGVIAAKLAGVPMIITGRRDTGMLCQGGWLHILAYKLTNPLVTKIVCVSEAVKKVVLEKERAQPDKVEVIYNGVDFEKIEGRRAKGEGREKLKEQLGIKPNELVVGMVANFSWIKGYEVLLKAAPEIIREVPNVKFLFIGEGPLLESCKLQAANLGLLEAKLEAKPLQASSSTVPERLSLDGAVPGRHSLERGKIIFLGKRTDIPELLSIMDVSLNLSYSEGMSNTILESMAAGVPPVVTAVDGNLETVDENTGILVPVRDHNAVAQAIINLLKDNGLRKKLGERARQVVKEKFDSKIMINKMEKLYLELAKKR